MSKWATFLSRRAAWLERHRLSDMKSDVSSQGKSLWRFLLRGREPRASKVCIFAARVVVTLAGLYFVAVGATLIAAGFASVSWSLVLLGDLIAPAALLVVWSGIAAGRENRRSAPVVVVSELLARILG